MMSRSLMPCCIFSRICFLRSFASSAGESAMVWFWHTRQRRFSESSMTRFSSAGSSAAGALSAACAMLKISADSISTSSLRILELGHERDNLLHQDFRRERTDLLVSDHAALVDHIGFRNAIDAVVDADLSFGIKSREPVRIPEALQPRQA